MYLNDGAGGFQAPYFLNSGGAANELYDLDRDGFLDLLIVGSVSAGKKVYFNDGAGTLVNSPVAFGTSDSDSTDSMEVADLDFDGDLDVITTNRGQGNKLYLNDGAGGLPAAGILIGPSATNDTVASALADFDNDGDYDLVSGNFISIKTLHRTSGRQLHNGRVASLKVNSSATGITEATLTATDEANTAALRNTSIDYYLSNDGGTKWHCVESGTRFTFPSAGDDLRWGARLGSLSPSVTPSISSVNITSAPAANVAPVAVDDTATLDEGENLLDTTGVLANDTDANSDQLTAILVTDAAHGTLVLNSDGTFSYLHDGSETTSDSFTYKANDGVEDSNVATVNITVIPVNDPPSASISPINTTRDSAGTEQISVSDADSSSFAYDVYTLPSSGEVSLSSTGWVTYVPQVGFTGADSFTIEVSDVPDGAADLLLVNVVVAPPVVELDEPELAEETFDETETDCLAVVLKDLNGDGLIDAAVGDEADRLILIYYNAGDGTFGDPVEVDAGGVPVALAAGDLDDDDDIDLVAVLDLTPPAPRGAGAVDAAGSFYLSVFLNNDDDGTFANQPPVVSAANAVAPFVPDLGDVDGDGEVDIVAAGAGPQDVKIFSGSAAGQVQLSSQLVWNNPGPPNLSDLDGDDQPDISVADTGTDTIGVFLNDTDDIATDDFVTGGTAEASTGSGHLASGLFDDDTNTDLAVSGGATGEVAVLLGQGDGTFDAAAKYLSSGTPSEVIARDFDSNAALDLAVLEAPEKLLKLLMGDGEGSFESVLNFDVEGTPASLSAGDLDGDGLLDLAVVDQDTGRVRTFKTGVSVVKPPVAAGGGGGGGGGCFVLELLE